MNAAAVDADLVILKGMGRGIESNFEAAFAVDAIWLAMLNRCCSLAKAPNHGSHSMENAFS